MSWFSQNFIDPIENVGNAIVHGDITGGQYQASGSDWGKAALDVGALAAGGIGAAGLAGVGPAAGALGGAGAGLSDIFGAGGATAAEGADFVLPASATPEALTANAAYAPDASSWIPAPQDTSPVGSYVPSDSPLTAGGGQPLSLQAVAGGAGGGGADSSSFFGTLGKQIMANPLKDIGIVAAGGGLAMNLLKGNPNSVDQNAVRNNATFAQGQAAALTQESTQLRSYLENGNLPPALQAQVDQLVKAQKATIIANAAKNGQSTDPTQNSALAADLAAADRQGLISAGQMEATLFQQGQQLLTTGLNSLQLSSASYTQLTNWGRQDEQDLEKAIATFAGSLAGGGGTKIQIGGTTAA